MHAARSTYTPGSRARAYMALSPQMCAALVERPRAAAPMRSSAEMLLARKKVLALRWPCRQVAARERQAGALHGPVSVGSTALGRMSMHACASRAPGGGPQAASPCLACSCSHRVPPSAAGRPTLSVQMSAMEKVSMKAFSTLTATFTIQALRSHTGTGARVQSAHVGPHASRAGRGALRAAAAQAHGTRTAAYAAVGGAALRLGSSGAFHTGGMNT